MYRVRQRRVTPFVVPSDSICARMRPRRAGTLPLPDRERTPERVARLVDPSCALEHGGEVLVCRRLPPDVVRPRLRGGDCRARQRLRLLELASMGEAGAPRRPRPSPERRNRVRGRPEPLPGAARPRRSGRGSRARVRATTLVVAAGTATWAMARSLGDVPACALQVAFDPRDQPEVPVGVPGGVAGHLAQVARPRLGERPRLVEAAEHREQHRPREILGTREAARRRTRRSSASHRRPAAGRGSAPTPGTSRTASSRLGAGSEAPGATLRRRRRAACGSSRQRRAPPRAAQAGVDHPAPPRGEAPHGRARSPRRSRRARLRQLRT